MAFTETKRNSTGLNKSHSKGFNAGCHKCDIWYVI